MDNMMMNDDLNTEFEAADEADAINPNHYKQGNIEVIEFILDQRMSYVEGNIIKYVSRYKFKNGLEDLKKARWYLDKLIETEERSQWMLGNGTQV